MHTLRLLTLCCLSLMFNGCQNQPPSSMGQKPGLRISSAEEPLTLDPRLSRNLVNITYIKMFYEGLMSQDKEGEVTPAVARDVQVSNHGKTYTFHLRECNWSNGDPITAQDFEFSLKSLLASDFPAPLANQLFMIKGAKEAKEGKGSLDEIKIKALDDRTLVIDLAESTPYFLELTTTPIFCPVHRGWASDPTKALIGNGPFQLSRWERGSEVHAVRNPNYWNASQVKLDSITVMVLDENTALKMFETGQLDWAGSPLSTIPTDAKVALKSQNRLSVSSAAGTHWFYFNTEAEPFNHIKLRKAFSSAINRSDIVEHIVQGNQIGATGIVPISFGLQTIPYFEDHNIKYAKELFNEALSEMNLQKTDLPPLTFSYASTELNNKIAQAVAKHWEEAFGLEIKLENCEGKIYYDRLAKRDFQFGIGSFYADYRDPFNFLEIFKYKNNPINSSQWENKQFTELLNLSARVMDKQNRMNILRRAEKILVAEMPVAPVYYNCYNFIKNDKVHDVYFSDLGYLDFKSAYIN